MTTHNKCGVTNGAGFSLIELAIVLVILALLVGGVLTGQSLMRSSEIQSTLSQKEKYETAIKVFKNKYESVPGDMPDATNFWGHQMNVATCVTNSSTTVTSSGTCDGNGNGFVNDASAASQPGERFQFWRQLVKAGLIEGDFSGVAGTSAFNALDYSNSPSGQIPSTIWSTTWLGVYAGVDGAFFATDYGHEINFGSLQNARPLSPQEAWKVDTKIDDGNPGRGKVIAGEISTCTTAGNAAGSRNLLDSDYLLSSNSLGCSLFFVRAY